MAFINICHHCKAAVEAEYDTSYYKAYVCPRCHKPFTDTYGVFSKEWKKWSEEKKQEYIQASLTGTKKEFFEKYPVSVDKSTQIKTRILLFAFMAACLAIGLLCWSAVPVISVACFVLDIVLVCIIFSARKDHGINYEMNEILRYDADSHTLHIYRRDRRIADYVDIKDDRNVHIKHEPQKLHIGAVRVGNVTTGGAYTTGGYNYISGTTKSGFARLEYKGNIVCYIQLHRDLYDQAKESKIAEYLNHNTKQIRAIGNGVFTQEDVAQMFANYAATGFTGNFDQTKATFAQCALILAWMCGDP